MERGVDGLGLREARGVRIVSSTIPVMTASDVRA